MLEGVEEKDVEDKAEVFRLKSGTGPTGGSGSTPVFSGLLYILSRRALRLRRAPSNGKHLSLTVPSKSTSVGGCDLSLDLSGWLDGVFSDDTLPRRGTAEMETSG